MNEEYLTIDQLCERWGVDTSTLEALESEGIISDITDSANGESLFMRTEIEAVERHGLHVTAITAASDGPVVVRRAPKILSTGDDTFVEFGV